MERDVILMTDSTIADTLIILLLSFNDHKQRILKPRNPTKYYVAFGLFGLINLTVYTDLCALLFRVDPISPRFFEDKFKGLEFGSLHYIQPVVIAVIYPASGIVSVKIGDREFDIYQKLLTAFRSLMSIEFSTVDRGFWHQLRKRHQK